MTQEIQSKLSYLLSQLDVLQFIHSNEYVHADINAENIYIKPGQDAQVMFVQVLNRFCILFYIWIVFMVLDSVFPSKT